MNAMMTTAIESEAAVILSGVDEESVADALAHQIVNEHISDIEPDESIEAGVRAAIDEIDEATFGFAVDMIRGRVAAEVEALAKEIALRMLRETAARAEWAAAACSVEGGI